MAGQTRVKNVWVNCHALSDFLYFFFTRFSSSRVCWVFEKKKIWVIEKDPSRRINKMSNFFVYVSFIQKKRKSETSFFTSTTFFFVCVFLCFCFFSSYGLYLILFRGWYLLFFRQIRLFFPSFLMNNKILISNFFSPQPILLWKWKL